MATPTELARVVEYCEDRWPGTRNFRHVEKAAWDFGGIPARALHEAAQHHFTAGERTAPTLSQLRHEGARIAVERGWTDPQTTECATRGHHGARAIEDARDSHGRLKTDGNGNPLREGMCVECGDTTIRPAHQLLTEGEKAAQREGAQEPAGAGDPLADRISP
jgi:hypothetical protein